MLFSNKVGPKAWSLFCVFLFSLSTSFPCFLCLSLHVRTACTRNIQERRRLDGSTKITVARRFEGIDTMEEIEAMEARRGKSG
ncbi:hypothetical protein QR685DRAFT_94742 [Neurospora intermedia]|uniref:Secreted protein n=1 Tax=Neurospora intermedia TaxID=5142 RepID=A0ABR3D5J2_NEUIN